MNRPGCLAHAKPQPQISQGLEQAPPAAQPRAEPAVWQGAPPRGSAAARGQSPGALEGAVGVNPGLQKSLILGWRCRFIPGAEEPGFLFTPRAATFASVITSPSEQARKGANSSFFGSPERWWKGAAAARRSPRSHPPPPP